MGFIPARTLVLVFYRRSADTSVDKGVIRRSGGDKPRRYTGSSLKRGLAGEVLSDGYLLFESFS